ncbi:MAG: endonuclease domain-containing protein [Opitutaceae bacterium]
MPDAHSERQNNLPALKHFRKKLRRHMTPAEAKLWIYLKGKQLEGRKFRRQHSVRQYILDFYCPTAKLAIELDGQSHDSAMAAEYDHERTLVLQATGIRVIRFENRTVFEHPEWVLEQIRKVVNNS